MQKFIQECHEKVLREEILSEENAKKLFSLDNKKYLLLLMHAASDVCRKYKGDKVDICALINAKSGLCSEDCKFCSQSSHYKTESKTYPFVGIDAIVSRAREMKNIGVHRFCIVTSGNEVTDDEFEQILKAAKIIHIELKMEMDCSLGHLTQKRLNALKDAGVTRYNHNLETSSDYFSKICSTHTFFDRLETVKNVKEHGLERCCGGIIGMGENFSDRLKLALTLRDLKIECVPINILNPRPGTPLEKTPAIPPLEILKTIAIFRLLLPKSTIKIAGGREYNLRSLQSTALLAGANGIIMSGYLTTQGQLPENDFQMLKDLEMEH